MLLKIVKTKGIVIGEQVYSESSKILKVFSRDLGIISILSKGCRKTKSPFHAASNKLIYASFDISYKEDAISTLIAVDIMKIFKNIVMDYRDLEKKMYAFLLVDLTSQVVKDKNIIEDERKSIYDIFLSCLNKIDEGFNANIIFNIARLKYLEYLGVRPSIDACSSCGDTSSIITLAASSFGYICKNCYTNEKIVQMETVKMIRMLYYVIIDKIKKLEIKDEIAKEIEEFLDEYYDLHTGIYLKTKDKYKTVLKINGVLTNN